MVKQCQIVATEKNTKSEATKVLTKIHRASNQGGLFEGFTKKYKPKDENGVKFPSESRKVQLTVQEALELYRDNVCPLLNVTATKDYGNLTAVADVEVDGKVLLKAVPATNLIFLEKQLHNIRTFIEGLPVLDSSEEWKYDEAAGMYKTDPVDTVRTKKVQKAIVLYDATDRHPAQTQLISEDEVIGTWSTVKQSGAIPVNVKRTYLKKVNELIEAVIKAREAANSKHVELKSNFGEALFGHILGS